MTDLKSIRRGLSMTQAEMAEKLGLHQTTISRMETGDLPIDQRTTLALSALQTAYASQAAAA